MKARVVLGKKIKVVSVTCPKCAHEYVPRSEKILRCPRCFTRYK